MKRLVEKEALEKIYETLRESWIFEATRNDPNKVAKAQDMVFDLIKNTPSYHNPVTDEAKRREAYKLAELATDAREIAMRLDWLRMDKEKELRK